MLTLCGTLSDPPRCLEVLQRKHLDSVQHFQCLGAMNHLALGLTRFDSEKMFFFSSTSQLLFLRKLIEALLDCNHPNFSGSINEKSANRSFSNAEALSTAE